MTTPRKLSADEKELKRAWQISGRVVFDQKYENNINLKWQLIYQIGKRFWHANYLDLALYDEAAVFIAKEALRDIIIALRAEIESMYAELEEPCETLTSPADLETGAENALVAIKIMHGLDGAVYFCRKAATNSSKFNAFFALGDTCVAFTDRDSEADAARFIISGMGMRAVLLMLKEYDELVKRCSSTQRVTDKLCALPELVSRHVFAAKGDEDAATQAPKKRKTKV